ncbi:hypothetical protein LB505_005234 [Fusarium chuoi]|nr:hypothetical protein LB505_005234 [Fusarium chuoi]
MYPFKNHDLDSKPLAQPTTEIQEQGLTNPSGQHNNLDLSADGTCSRNLKALTYRNKKQCRT